MTDDCLKLPLSLHLLEKILLIFSSSYFGYFWVCVSHVIRMLLNNKNEVQVAFAMVYWHTRKYFDLTKTKVTQVEKVVCWFFASLELFT